MQSHASLFESLFKRNISSPDNSILLEEVVNKYPFFVPAQFYLLQQVKNDPEAFDREAIKTSLLFNNTCWLNFQLEQSFTEDIPSIDHQPETTTEIIDPAQELHDQHLVIAEKIETMLTEIQPASTEPLLFEPLYASDYFASQGIKLTDDVQPTDKLAMQLKSFTEWLKTMKKIQASKIMPSQSDPQTDEKIQTLAEQSNHEEDVVTEAMAEVLTQQGQALKAIDVYEKLSLLNPAKSIYFASKIEQLKEH